MSVTAPLIIPAPRIFPFPSGLFSVIDFRNDAHFEMGVQWEPMANVPLSGIEDYFEACAAGGAPTGLPKHFLSLNDLAEADGYTVYGSYKCNPLGYTIQHAQDMAEADLALREQAFVEHTTWTGVLGNSPNFAQVHNNGASVDIALALAAVEQWIADHVGGVGVIHVNRGDALLFFYKGLFVVDANGTVRTALGTPVVAGAGYPAASPFNGAAGHWIVGTGPLVGERSEVYSGTARPGDLLDRGKNILYGIAERNYLIGFDVDTAVAQQFSVT